MTATALPTSSESARVCEVVSEIVRACRDAEHAFERAARTLNDPVFRAELNQYSVQRREFIMELQDALAQLGGRADDDLAALSGNHSRWEALEHAAQEGERVVLLQECESFDRLALDAYRHALQSGLPYAIDGVTHSHFYDLTRVQSRLQCLADLAGGSSPIDTA